MSSSDFHELLMCCFSDKNKYLRYFILFYITRIFLYACLGGETPSLKKIGFFLLRRFFISETMRDEKKCSIKS